MVGHRNDPSAESRSRRRAGHHCAATEVRGCMYFHLFIIISIIFVHVFVCLLRLHQNKSNIDCNLRPAQKQVVGRRNDRSAVCTAESRARWRAGHHCAATQVRGCMYFHLFIIISIIFVHVFVCLLRLHQNKSNIDCNLRPAQKQVVGRRNDPSAEARYRRRADNENKWASVFDGGLKDNFYVSLRRMQQRTGCSDATCKDMLNTFKGYLNIDVTARDLNRTDQKMKQVCLHCIMISYTVLIFDY